jgi:hypothetical protein
MTTIENSNNVWQSGLTLGIRFHDNDFWCSITKFLEILKLKDNLRNDASFTKAQIVQCYNETIYGIYLMYQNCFTYGAEKDGIENDHLKSYLKIKESNIYFGNEVSQFLQDHDYDDNGEFHVLCYDQVQSY